MRRIAMALGFCLFACSATLSQQVEISAQPVFGRAHMAVFREPMEPLWIVLQNKGPSLKGYIEANSGSNLYRMPVDLPSGSTKRALIYPPGGLPDSVAYVAGRRRFVVKSAYAPPQLGIPLVAIGDEFGGLEAFAASSVGTDAFAKWIPDYVRPENAPDRSIGYAGRPVLIVGAGAERLAEAQWGAILLHTARGGRLYLLGGPGAVYLSAPGLADALPVERLRVKSGLNLAPLARALQGRPFSDRATGTVGALRSGAALLAGTDEECLMAVRSYGLGTVCFVAVSLWDRPLSQWPDKHKLIDVANWREAERVSIESLATATYWSTSADTVASKITLPSANTVVGALFAYFVLVVPVNYFVLKRRKALHKSWLTALICSLAFVGVAYALMADLRSLHTMVKTQGVLIVPTGAEIALLYATGTIFSSAQGRYELKAPAAEMYRADDSAYAPVLTSVRVIDDGRDISAQVDARNLSFMRTHLDGRIDLGGKVSATVRHVSGKRYRGSIVNGTTFELQNATVIYPNVSMGSRPLTIRPGETVTFEADLTWASGAQVDRQHPSSPQEAFGAAGDRLPRFVALRANINLSDPLVKAEGHYSEQEVVAYLVVPVGRTQ